MPNIYQIKHLTYTFFKNLFNNKQQTELLTPLIDDSENEYILLNSKLNKK